MAKWMTLYKVLKNTTVLSKALLNTTLYVFRRARYNVAVNFSVSSRMLPYKASMARGSFLYTLSSSIPKERDREKSGDPAGHKYDMLFPYQRDVNECHSVPSVQPSKKYSCTVPARKRNISEAILICFRAFVQILQAKTSRPFDKNHPVLRRFHSTSMFLVCNKV